MADITPARANIQQEAVTFRAAVSESILQTVGASINFINNRQFDSKPYFINGPYAATGVNETAVDGLYIVPPGINSVIFAVAMYNITAGSGGTTTLDVKVATASGGSFTTIFATPPAIASTAGNNAWVATGGSGTGLTAPVLTGTTYDLNAGYALRVDFTGKQTGRPENCGLILYTRPR